MKICYISKADSFGGGASRCAETLTEIFRNEGHEVDHFCYWSGKGFNEYRKPLIGKFFDSIMKFRIVIEKKILGFPELIPFEYFYLLRKKIHTYDLVHFHDISSAISPLTVKWLSKKMPTVWTFHDCSPFTGGCLYPGECMKFKKWCSKCAFKNWPIDSKFAKTTFMQWIKKGIFKSNVSLITPSTWMKNIALESNIINKDLKVVFNGVDTSIYYPRKDSNFRELNGIKNDDFCILISASDFKDYRKGGVEAVKAISSLPPDSLRVLVLGRENDELKDLLSNYRVSYLGYQSDASYMAEIFSNSNVFLFPSLEDNQPLSILESLACGTPVVSFNTGGIPEIINHKMNGYISKKGDIKGLVEGILYCKKNEDQLSKNSLEYVKKNHLFKSYYKNHLDVYEKVIMEYKK